MLDKSLPYKRIVMALAPGAQPAPPALPAGYTLRLYRPGDEAAWAETEASVLEFASPAAALDYFKAEYLPQPQQLARGLVFACDAAGTPVANASAWPLKADPAVPTLHWVAVRPGQQGKGLGRAVVQQAVMAGQRQWPGKTMLLQTQTWSHVAVRLYHSLGWQLVKNPPCPGMENDYDEAMQVLKGVYPPALWAEMAAAARSIDPKGL